MGKWTYGELATDRVAVSRPRSLSDAVLDTAPDAVVTFDACGHIVALSSDAERRLGFEHAEVLCRSIAHHAIAGAPAGSRGVVGGERLELPATWADGREVLVELSFVRTCRSPVRFTAWLRELGEPRTLRVQAQRNAALLASAEEFAHLGRWEWTPKDDELVCSAELCRILGLPSRERRHSATVLLERVHPDDRAPLRRALVLLRASGGLQPLAYRVALPDGALRYVRATLAVAAWRDGQAHRIVGWVQDVTEQHLAEREIAAHCAVTEALDGWTSLDTGARRLLASLGEAMDAEAGVFWVPLAGVLVAPVVWTAGSDGPAEFAAASDHARLAPGA
ncbi:MAG: PAS domain-containing protein, partial [Solirubrobacteraceae bacterium]